MAVTVVTKDTFDAEVLQASASQTVLVDFWASWCNPCRMLSPLVDKIAEENPSIKVCKINIVNEHDFSLVLNCREVMVNLVGRNPVQGSQFFRC